ncbi:MAG TPA: hypothetical protein VGR67_14230 [Candidatus Polarisedimenticolia bacterium]|nr:hypothetical protein [Candidatus Polarisedimenticolia bacterium]
MEPGTPSSGFVTRRSFTRSCGGRGADVVYGPVIQPAYRMEEFAVRDREGYVLGFGQALES